MKYLWNLLEKTKWKQSWKRRMFLFLSVLIFAALGLGIWGIVQLFALKSTPWMLCFVGYPAVLAGYLGGIIFLWNKE